MQGYISLLNPVEETDQERPDPLWMEMFSAITPAAKGKSEASAEWKSCHKFWERTD